MHRLSSWTARRPFLGGGRGLAKGGVVGKGLGGKGLGILGLVAGVVDGLEVPVCARVRKGGM